MALTLRYRAHLWGGDLGLHLQNFGIRAVKCGFPRLFIGTDFKAVSCAGRKLFHSQRRRLGLKGFDFLVLFGFRLVLEHLVAANGSRLFPFQCNGNVRPLPCFKCRHLTRQDLKRTLDSSLVIAFARYFGRCTSCLPVILVSYGVVPVFLQLFAAILELYGRLNFLPCICLFGDLRTRQLLDTLRQDTERYLLCAFEGRLACHCNLGSACVYIIFVGNAICSWGKLLPLAGKGNGRLDGLAAVNNIGDLAHRGAGDIPEELFQRHSYRQFKCTARIICIRYFLCRSNQTSTLRTILPGCPMQVADPSCAVCQDKWKGKPIVPVRFHYPAVTLAAELF